MSTDAPATFGQHLNALRRQRGLSKYAVCRRGRLSPITYRRLEKEHHHPRRQTIITVAHAMALSDAERGHLLFSAGYWPDCPEIALVIAQGEIARRRQQG